MTALFFHLQRTCTSVVCPKVCVFLCRSTSGLQTLCPQIYQPYNALQSAAVLQLHFLPLSKLQGLWGNIKAFVHAAYEVRWLRLIEVHLVGGM